MDTIDDLLGRTQPARRAALPLDLVSLAAASVAARQRAGETGAFDQYGTDAPPIARRPIDALGETNVASLLNRPNPIQVTPPGTRAAGVSTPNTTTAAAPSAATPSVDPGAMDQFGNRTPGVATVQPALDEETRLSNAFQRTVGSPTISGLSRADNAIRSVASDPRAQSAFNQLQDARGHGIQASTDARGQLSLSGGPATRPQAFTSGFDLAGANERLARALDANNDRATRSQIQDLVSELPNANPVRAQQIQGTIAALAGLRSGQQQTVARVDLEGAQAAQARATAAATNQSTGLTAAQQKQVTGLQQQLIAEADPRQQKVLQDKLLTLLGKDPRQGQYQIAIQEEPIDPNNPFAGTKKVPYLIDQRGGPDGKPFAQRVDEAASGQIGVKAPQVPAGYKQIGMSGGKPVYEDKDGKRFIAG